MSKTREKRTCGISVINYIIYESFEQGMADILNKANHRVNVRIETFISKTTGRT